MTSLEVADIFRACAPAWRAQRAGHLSLGQLKAMSAIERGIVTGSAKNIHTGKVVITFALGTEKLSSPM